MSPQEALYIEVGDLTTASEEEAHQDVLLEQQPPSQAERSFFWKSTARLSLVATACFVCAGAVILLQPTSGLRRIEDRDLSALTPTTQINQCGDVGYDPLKLNVVSYNLFWWCVSDQYRNCAANGNGAGFDKLYERIKLNHPFDLIGLQECDDVTKIVNNTGYADCLDYYQPPVKEGNDVAQAWNKQKYTKISEGTKVVAADRYGKRRVNWVRLQVKTGGTIFFANTHGPLEQCAGDVGRKVGDAYVKVINEQKHKDDLVVFTGDFNCGQFTDTMDQLKSKLSQAAVGNSFDGADHIYTNGLKVLSKASVKGEPSDHQLLKASFQLPAVPVPANQSNHSLVPVPANQSNHSQVLQGLTVTSGGIQKKSIPQKSLPIAWNVASSQTIMPLTSSTTTAEPEDLNLMIPNAAKDLRQTLYIFGALVLTAGLFAAVIICVMKRASSGSLAGSVERSMRVARRSNPLSPSSMREVFTPERAEEGYDSPRATGSRFNFREFPPVASPERPPTAAASAEMLLRQLQDACVEGAQMEVFSKSTSRWLNAEIVKAKDSWVVAEYAAADGSVRRSNVNLSADDVHERIRVPTGGV